MASLHRLSLLGEGCRQILGKDYMRQLQAAYYRGLRNRPETWDNPLGFALLLLDFDAVAYAKTSHHPVYAPPSDPSQMC